MIVLIISIVLAVLVLVFLIAGGVKFWSAYQYEDVTEKKIAYIFWAVCFVFALCNVAMSVTYKKGLKEEKEAIENSNMSVLTAQEKEKMKEKIERHNKKCDNGFLYIYEGLEVPDDYKVDKSILNRNDLADEEIEINGKKYRLVS